MRIKDILKSYRLLDEICRLMAMIETNVLVFGTVVTFFSRHKCNA